MADVSVVVSADASAVELAMARSKAAVLGFSGALGGALAGVANDLANVVVAQGKINFGAQLEQVRAFELATARLGVASGQSLESVRASTVKVGKEIGQLPSNVAKWTSEVGKLTYSFGGAEESMRTMAGLAAMTGRDVQEYKGLAVTLGQIGVVGKNTSEVVGTMAAQSDKFGVSVAANVDRFEALGDVVTHFSNRGASGIASLNALVLTLGNGLDEVSAKRVGANVLGALSSNTMGTERFLGHSILDAQGHVQSPIATLKEYAAKVRRMYGANTREEGIVLRSRFTDEGAAAIQHANWTKAAQVMGMAPSSKPEESLQQFHATDAGQREVAQATLQSSSINLMGSSTKLGQAADALQKFSASHPVAGAIVASAAGGMASSAIHWAAGGMTLSLAKKALANGGVALGLGGAAAIAGAGAVGLGAGGALGYGLLKLHDMYDQSKISAVSAETAKAKIIRDQVRAARAAAAGHSIDASTSVATEGRGGVAQQHVVGALVEALRAGVKVEVTNATDTPLTAATKSSRSASAGSQKGG